MALEYLLFNEGKSGALVRIISDRGMIFTFQDDFYIVGSLSTRTPEEAMADSKMQGFAAYETVVGLTDKNRFFTTIRYNAGQLVDIDTFTTIRYNAGQLVDIDTRTTELVEVNPKRAFEFWLKLSKELREHPETPDNVKGNLERIAHITSLEGHFKQLRERRVEVDFHQGYLQRVRPEIARDYA